MMADILARAPFGTLRGTPEGGSTVFRGVPYAAPPVGTLRFQPARPATAWTGERPAVAHGPIAPQNRSDLAHFMGDFDREQGEDCLTLTVWTPAADAERRPVLLWFHGGAFVSGAGSLDWYSGAALAAEGGIVVVHANYRLGALGYLCWPGAAPGNMALSDQAMALRWVQQAIGAFGGDPARITVGGQSAGANSTGRLLLDPALRPGMHRVLLQSGGFGREPSTQADAEPTARVFLQALGIDPDNSGVAAGLSAASLPDILRAQAEAEQLGFTLPMRQQAWRPVFDLPITTDALLDEMAAALAGQDVLIGVTSREAHAFVGGPIPSGLELAAVAGRLAQLTGDPDALAMLQAAHPGATPAQLMAELHSAHHFVGPSLALAERAAARGARVHTYVFDWAPRGSVAGAGHCIDLAFAFGTWQGWAAAPMLAGGDPVVMAEVSASMRHVLTSFVASGAPCTDPMVEWPAYVPGRVVMRIGEASAAMAGVAPSSPRPLVGGGRGEG